AADSPDPARALGEARGRGERRRLSGRPGFRLHDGPGHQRRRRSCHGELANSKSVTQANEVACALELEQYKRRNNPDTVVSHMARPSVDVANRVQDVSGSVPESAYAWIRLACALSLSAIGGVGMWSVIVALPTVQAEFGVARSAASRPSTVTLICFGFGGILLGRLPDRLGIFVPAVGGAVTLALGYAAASQATTLGHFILTQGLLVGVASSVTFGPIIADTSLWF